MINDNTDILQAHPHQEEKEEAASVPSSEPVQSESEGVSQEHSPEVPAESEDIGKWYSEQYNDLVNTKGLKSPDDVLDRYMNLEKMIGDSVRAPKEGASPEEVAKCNSKIKDLYLNNVVPKEASQYGLDSLIEEKYPNIDKDAIKNELTSFEEEAVKLGLDIDQVRGIVDNRLKADVTYAEHQNAMKIENQKTIQQNWGVEYDSKLNDVNEAIKALSKEDSENTKLLVENSLDNPILFKMLADLGSEYKESPITMGQADLPSSRKAEEEITRLHSDAEFMESYRNVTHPNHSEATARMIRLFRVKNQS